MRNKRTLLILIAVLCIIFLVLFVLYPENLRSFGKSVLQTGTSLRIGLKEPTEPIEAAPTLTGGFRGISDFTVYPYSMKVSIKQGESEKKFIEIANIGDIILEISIELGDLERFIVLSEDSFSLGRGILKRIDLDIFAAEDELPDSYIGNIIVKGNAITKKIYTIIEVKEKKPIFNITTEVIEKELRAGDDAKAAINILNLGDLENIDILLYYAIKDFEGSVLTDTEEDLIIDKELNIEKSLKIPQGTLDGEYIFYSKVSYQDIFATSSDTFSVVSEELLAPAKFNMIFLWIILLLIIIILVLFIKERKSKEQKPLKKDRNSR